MELSTVSLFWRDKEACCFTLFRFFEPTDLTIRAQKMASCIETFSNLQLYCVIVNEQILDWQPRREVPLTGTHHRIEINIYPSQPLNPRAGIGALKITIPGPKPEIAEIFTASPPNGSHPYWQMLEIEVMPWIRLPNGLPVSPKPGAARIQRAQLVEIAEQYRPQLGRPPVDAAISSTIKGLDEARSRLSRVQRANQPIEFELARVERYQHQLAQLQTLHKLEQSVWLKLTSSTHIEELPLDEINQTQLLALLIDKTHYLPAIPSPVPLDWADLPAQDFSNPDLWEQIGQLKTKFAITSERSKRARYCSLKIFRLTHPASSPRCPPQTLLSA